MVVWVAISFLSILAGVGYGCWTLGKSYGYGLRMTEETRIKQRIQEWRDMGVE